MGPCCLSGLKPLTILLILKSAYFISQDFQGTLTPSTLLDIDNMAHESSEGSAHITQGSSSQLPHGTEGGGMFISLGLEGDQALPLPLPSSL